MRAQEKDCHGCGIMGKCMTHNKMFLQGLPASPHLKPRASSVSPLSMTMRHLISSYQGALRHRDVDFGPEEQVERMSTLQECQQQWKGNAPLR